MSTVISLCERHAEVRSLKTSRLLDCFQTTSLDLEQLGLLVKSGPLPLDDKTSALACINQAMESLEEALLACASLWRAQEAEAAAPLRS